MTVRAVTPRVVAAPASLGRGVSVYPSATAMVWPGAGQSHQAVAVPGVRLAPGDVLVEVEVATVCPSDVRMYHGARHAPAPLVLGHEQVGRVIALGRGGAKTTGGQRLAIGDRVVWSAAVPCRRCARCRRGFPQRCVSLQKYGHERMRRGWELSGGFATHTHILDGTPIVQVPDDIPAEILAPASCSTATTAAALEAASGIVPLEDALVLISSAGQHGLTAAAMATEAGARVVVSDPVPERREAAAAFGAVAVADPCAAAASPAGLAAALARVGGRGAAANVVLELTGAPATVTTLLSAIDVGGVLVVTGSAPAGPDANAVPQKLVQGLLTVRGVHDYAPRHLEQAVDFLVRAWQTYPFADQVGATFALSDVDAALSSPTPLRVAVRP